MEIEQANLVIQQNKERLRREAEEAKAFARRQVAEAKEQARLQREQDKLDREAAKRSDTERKRLEKEEERRYKEELKQKKLEEAKALLAMKEEMKQKKLEEKLLRKQEEEERKEQEKLEAVLKKRDGDVAKLQSYIERSEDRPTHWDSLTIVETEYYDARSVAWVFVNWDILVEKGLIGRAFDPVTCEYIADNVYRSQFQKFIKELDIEQFPIAKRKVTYSQCSYKYGRYICRDILGLQGISRPLRQTFCLGIYRDLDIVNCHPVIYLDLCKRNNLPTEFVELYINRREEMIAKLIEANPGTTRDFWKTFFLSGLNGGSNINSDKFKDMVLFRELEQFLEEVKSNHKALVEIFDKTHPQYKKSVITTLGEEHWNLNGSIVNHYLVDKENQIEFYLVDFLKYEYKTQDDKHYSFKPQVHCFDGCMINIQNKKDLEYLTEDVIIKAQEYIELKTGLQVKLKYKDFDEYIDIPHNEYMKMTADMSFWKYFNWRNIDELGGGDKVCSDLCKKFFEDDFILTDLQKVTGYTFKVESKIWKSVSSQEIQNSISDILMDAVRKGIKFWSEKLKNAQDENEMEIYKSKCNDWVQRIKDRGNWGNSSKSKNVFECLKPMLKQDSFDEKMNVDNIYELPIKNGYVINLTTGETRERTHTDYYNYECPVSYTPWDNLDKTHQDIVLEYMNTMFDNKTEIINYMQALTGMLLTKDISNRSFYMVMGSGRNGKSFYFGELLKMILNRSYKEVDDKTFTGDSNFIDNLKSISNASIAVFSEGKEGKPLNVANLKRITGGDSVNGEQKNKSMIEFKTYCKPILLFNEAQAPECNAEDGALWDRLVCLHFPHIFDVSNTYENKKKTDSYKKHIDSFFSYFVEGCKKWYANPYILKQLPQEIIEETRRFKYKNDIVHLFINDKCEFGQDKTQNKEHLYNSFYRWADKLKWWVHRKVIGRNTFYELIEKKGFKEVREGTDSIRVFGGLKLIKTYEDEDDEPKTKIGKCQHTFRNATIEGIEWRCTTCNFEQPIEPPWDGSDCELPEE